jgi:formate dehydrogenase beta subunit
LPADHTIQRGTYQNPPDLDGNTWNLIEFKEIDDKEGFRWAFFSHRCMHCIDASCLYVCPTGAIKRSPHGFVYIDQTICIGCKNCVMACHFHIPRFNIDTGTVQKCRACLDRVEEGMVPACVKSCGPGALSYGDRAAMLAKARARVAELQRGGFSRAQLYGDVQAGGTHVFLVLTEDPKVFGLPRRPRVVSKRPVSILTSSLITIIAAAIIGLAGILKFRERGIYGKGGENNGA